MIRRLVMLLSTAIASCCLGSELVDINPSGGSCAVGTTKNTGAFSGYAQYYVYFSQSSASWLSSVSINIDDYSGNPYSGTRSGSSLPVSGSAGTLCATFRVSGTAKSVRLYVNGTANTANNTGSTRSVTCYIVEKDTVNGASSPYRTVTYSFLIQQRVKTLETYTISYEPGKYGSGNAVTDTKTEGTALTLRGEIFTRAGYSQEGWSKSTNGTSKAYSLGGSYTNDVDVTLYPYWVGKSYTVTLDMQGGSGGTSSKTVTYGSAMPSITIPTRDGYVFSGYFTGTEGTGAKYYNADGTSAHIWDYTNAKTLYAKWVQHTATSYGLFVGIDEYDSATWQTLGYIVDNLSGCVVDAKSMRMVCVDYGDWIEDNVELLTNRIATVSQYRAKVTALASKAVAGDTVIIYNSGHGGHDDSSPKSANLATYNGPYSDTDFATDLGKFATGVKVVVILDTCYSAGMFKSTGKNLNFSNPANTFMDNVSALIDSAHTKSNYSKGTITSSEIGWVTAADYNQTSQEVYIGTDDKGGMGWFTSFMLVDGGVLNDLGDVNGDGFITFKELYSSISELGETLGSVVGLTQEAQAKNLDVLESVRLSSKYVDINTAADNTSLSLTSLDDVGVCYWVGQDVGNNAHDGKDVLRSAVLPHNWKAVLDCELQGAGELSFWWRVSSEKNYDKLMLVVDGCTNKVISGVTQWAQVNVELGTGGHSVQWIYQKDGSRSVGDDCGWLDQITWTPVSPTPTLVAVNPVLVTGASTVDVFTNGTVKVAGSAPYMVYSNASVRVVYTADAGYEFAGGATTYEMVITADTATVEVAIPSQSHPTKKPVYVEVGKPVIDTILVYNGLVQSGVTNVDMRLIVRSGVTSAIDAGDYAVKIALPARMAETNFVWKGETDAVAKTNDLSFVWSIAQRDITLTSASDSKTWDGTPLINGAVTVGGSGFVTGEGFSYTVTGSQTDVGFSSNAFTYSANPGTKISNYAVAKIEGTLTVTPVVTHTVTFCAGAHGKFAGDKTSVDVIVNDGAAATAPALTVDAGWAFASWDKAFDNVTSDLTVTALYEEQSLVATVANPVITPAGGSTFNGDSCTVTITCATPEATIYYSTNGIAPKLKAANVYAGAFTIPDTRTIIAVATKTGLTQSEYVTAVITRVEPEPITLATAIDMPAATVQTDKDTPWLPIEDMATIGGSCAQSGAIGDGQSCDIWFSVTGPGKLTFKWKASCEGYPLAGCFYDHGAFCVDGVEQVRIDGETGWSLESVDIIGAGQHEVKWSYVKDEEDSAGNDCIWLDQVVWTPSANYPLLDDDATPEQVQEALEGSTDTRLAECITNGAVYNAYLDWAAAVTNSSGETIGVGAVKSAEHAWFSFAVGSDVLITELPTSDDVNVEAFEPSAESGKFDFTVSVDGVTIGSVALKENLKQVFGLEGAATLDATAFSSDKVEIDFSEPENGKVKFTAGPKDTSAGTFFMKVKMLP